MKSAFRLFLAFLVALIVLVECASVVNAAEKTYDYSTDATLAISGSAVKWTLQMPTVASRTGRLKHIFIQTYGGACEFTVTRDGSLATTGTPITPQRVTGKIDRSAVPAPAAVAYSGSNSSGGVQIGPVLRLGAIDRVTIEYDSKFLEPGESITVTSNGCTTTADISSVHEEYWLPSPFDLLAGPAQQVMLNLRSEPALFTPAVTASAVTVRVIRLSQVVLESLQISQNIGVWSSRSEFPVHPSSGDVLVIDGTTYFIVQVQADQTNGIYLGLSQA